MGGTSTWNKYKTDYYDWVILALSKENVTNQQSKLPTLPHKMQFIGYGQTGNWRVFRLSLPAYPSILALLQ